MFLLVRAPVVVIVYRILELEVTRTMLGAFLALIRMQVFPPILLPVPVVALVRIGIFRWARITVLGRAPPPLKKQWQVLVALKVLVG